MSRITSLDQHVENIFSFSSEKYKFIVPVINQFSYAIRDFVAHILISSVDFNLCATWPRIHCCELTNADGSTRLGTVYVEWC